MRSRSKGSSISRIRIRVRWLDPLDRRLGGEAAVDRLVDPARPALVIGEHLVGLEHLLMLAHRAELGVARHIVDLLAHLAEGGIDAVALGLDVLGDGMLDDDARLVKDGDAARHAGRRSSGLSSRAEPWSRAVSVTWSRGRRGRHWRSAPRAPSPPSAAPRSRHRRSARGSACWTDEHADRPLAPHDRNAGEAMENLLARFRAVGEFGMADRLGEVEHGDVARDRPDQALAERELGDVNRGLIEADASRRVRAARRAACRSSRPRSPSPRR